MQLRIILNDSFSFYSLSKLGFFMFVRRSMQLALRGTAMAVVAMSLHSGAFAQDAIENADGEFIGTVDIGESTRAVQTGTATAVTVVDKEEINDRQANTIAELVDSIPGVSLINGSTPTGSGINIRGFGANGTYGTDQKVAIQIDGASIGGEELYRIGNQLYTDPDLYKSVEVIRGTVGSFEYGSGIVGGVVRLQTSDALDLTDGKPGFALSQSLGAFTNGNALNSSTTAAWAPSEKLEFLANYSWREQENQVDGHGTTIENSAFGLPSFLLKAGVHLGADGEHIIRASFNQSTSADRDVPYDTFGNVNFGNVDRDTKSQVAILSYNFDPLANDAVNFEVRMSYANQDIEQRSIAGNSNLLNADHRYETYKANFKNTALFNTGPFDHNLRAGVEFITKKRQDASSAPGGTDNRTAFFLVDEIGLARGLSVTPAIRYEHSHLTATLNDGSGVNLSNEAVMGGVSVRYELPFGLAAFGSWAYTENMPILDDLQNAVFREQSEKATTYEFGGSYNKVGLFGKSDSLSVKVNYYDTALKDVTSYFGVTNVELDGVEAEASFATGNGFYVDFNANFVNGEEVRSSGDVLDWRNLPSNSYQLSVGKRIGGWLNLRWESYIAEDIDVNDTITPGYDTHTLRVILTPQGGMFAGFSLRASVENLFDSYYTPVLSTRTAPGRNFKFGISKKF